MRRLRGGSVGTWRVTAKSEFKQYASENEMEEHQETRKWGF